MADDEAGDKTEPATQRRRDEAREQGRIARSSDLVAAAGVLAGLVSLSVLGRDWLPQMLASATLLGDTPDVSISGVKIWTIRMAYIAAYIAVPMMLLLVVIAVAASMAQTGPLITWKKLTPELDKINPLNGAKRICSFDSLTRLGMTCLKLTIVGVVAYYAIQEQMPIVLALGGAAPAPLLAASLSIIYTVGIKVALALLILALADFAIEKFKLERSLRMTKQEVRDELKNMEGDPLIKHRRRQIQHRIAMQRVRMDTPKADVVVTNPTHYAVALKYDQATMTAPRVLVKGKDLMALRIRQIAQEHGIPVIERAPLARALYATAEVGQEVPPNLYRAVAEVLAYVYQLSGRKAASA